MEFKQPINQPIDIATWQREEEVYPEGKRVKTSVYCPDPAPYGFLDGNHRYIFKRSPEWAPEQFWTEIFAYVLGAQMQVDVPPAFVAYDSQKNQCGALIRWFLEPITLLKEEAFIRGGDLCQEKMPDFDRDSGEQHNFEIVAEIFNDLPLKYSEWTHDWKCYWAKVFVFDALIGNTDRHQDNWGIIESIERVFLLFAFDKNNTVNPLKRSVRISPVYDNGSSMGYEVLARKFPTLEQEASLQNYVLKGRHHIRWSLDHLTRMEHCEFLKKLIGKYPEMKQTMLECLYRVDSPFFEDHLDRLAEFNVPVKLSHSRSKFMLKLINFRHQRLLKELNDD